MNMSFLYITEYPTGFKIFHASIKPVAFLISRYPNVLSVRLKSPEQIIAFESPLVKLIYFSSL